MSYDFSRVNVLIVESTKEMFKLFRDVLTVLEVPEKNIEAAYSCEEGYHKFQRTNHDLIITDWLECPDKGVELALKVRKSENSPNRYVPIIMTAGSSHQSRVIKSRDAGVSDYLVKPFTAGDLATRISRAIEKPRPFVLTSSYCGPDRRVRNVPFPGEDRRVSTLRTEHQ